MSFIVSDPSTRNPESIIFEPSLKQKKFFGSVVLKNIKDFKKKSDLVIANRMFDEIKDIEKKVFTRDIYGKD